MLAEKETEKNRRAGMDVNASPPYWKIFKQAFPQLMNVFLVFFVTLTVFPAIHSGKYFLVTFKKFIEKIQIRISDIKSSDPENFPFAIKNFTTITCFLTFNVFAMIGSLLTSWITWVGFAHATFNDLVIIFLHFHFFAAKTKRSYMVGPFAICVHSSFCVLQLPSPWC
jgi:Nucleoside transporter